MAVQYPVAGRRTGWDYETYMGDQPRPGTAPAISPWLFILVASLNTVVAAVLAVLITLAISRPEAQRDIATRPSVGTLNTALAVPEPTRERTSAPPSAVELLPVGSAERPLQLEPLKAARLPLQLLPYDAASRETFILVLSGLPARASLTGGERIGSDSWLLPPGAFRRLELTLAEWSPVVIEIGIELRHTGGAIAARSKGWLSVPSPVQQSTATVDDAALREMIRRGDQSLGRGDIVAARTLYQRAAELGSADAALALGATYDPARLWSLGVFGMVGNKERARHWYMLADQHGQPAAKEWLKALGPP